MYHTTYLLNIEIIQFNEILIYLTFVFYLQTLIDINTPYKNPQKQQCYSNNFEVIIKIYS